MSDPTAIADAAGYAPYLSDEQKRELLETPDVEQRLETVIAWTRDHLAEAEIADKIGEDVREGMEKSQREFLLRQQLAAIRKELGEGEPEGADDYRARVEAADVPDDVRAALLKEVDKLERSSEQNPEAALDPHLARHRPRAAVGGHAPRTSNDVAGARAVLDADHHGLDEVKERIVEYLAVRARRAERGLAGHRRPGLRRGDPAGRASRRRQDLAGRVRRPRAWAASSSASPSAASATRPRSAATGARTSARCPGRIVRAIKEAGSMNPVVLLDEVDKIGADYRGDPAAALLEVLDPAQNHTFRDHYLELDLDLSDVLFIATANVVEQIPSALLDRMELVTLDGYTEDDKVAIARDFLLPRQLERAALTADEVTDLRRRAARARGQLHPRGRRAPDGAAAGQGAAQGGHQARRPARSSGVDIDRARPQGPGRPAAVHARVGGAHRRCPGVATGLAVTGLGGDVLFIEASASRRQGGAHPHRPARRRDEGVGADRAVLREAHAAELGIDPTFFEQAIHVHVPAGAIPKDGPSAGVTMVTALTSLATGRPVRSEVGMTGEVTLNGRVLPIGGLKQKLLAAQRAGLTEVFVPLRNEPDLDDVPAEVLEALTVHIVGDVLDVVRGALTPAAEARSEDEATAAA